MRTFIAISHRMLTAAAAVGALGLALPAQAQYPQQYGYPQTTTPQQYQAPQTPQYQAPQTPQYQTPQYAQTGVYQGYAPNTGYAPNAAAPNTAPYNVPRVAMAYQPNQAAPVASEPTLTPPAENVGPGVPQNGNYMPQPAPVAEPYAAPGYAANGYPAQGAAGANCNCQGGAPAAGYSSYGCDTTAYGSCNNYGYGGPMSNVLRRGAGCGYWFGGVYGLLMERDRGDKIALAFAAAGLNAGPPYDANSYAPSDSVVLKTRDADLDYMAGMEFRLGRTFGCSYDPCTCCTTGPKWGVEGVYWQLFEEDATATYVDEGTLRTYSMIDPRGLEYNNGNGYRPVRDYWDYAPPADDHSVPDDVEVRLARVRSSFEVQNFEINLLRLSICGGGANTCGGGGCDACAGAGACGGSYGYGGGCDGGCAPACGPKHSFSCTGVCGVRYLQFDEDFMYGVDFDRLGATYPAPIDGFLNYWSTVENSLIGFQLGCNGMYRIGCKWGVHVNTAFGLYGNDIDVRQYMTSPTGLVRFVQSQENFDVWANKTDVAMMGEMRLGVSYAATCRCRLYGGWRAMGITGVALAADQHPAAFIDAAQLQNYVNSNGSLILHGLQAGVEWNY